MSVHVLAVLKGAVEGAPQRHFTTTSAYGFHLAEATRLGLVDVPDVVGIELSVTDRGRQFYIDANLASLPAGRASHWGRAADRALDKLFDLSRSLRRSP